MRKKTNYFNSEAMLTCWFHLLIIVSQISLSFADNNDHFPPPPPPPPDSVLRSKCTFYPNFPIQDVFTTIQYFIRIMSFHLPKDLFINILKMWKRLLLQSNGKKHDYSVL